IQMSAFVLDDPIVVLRERLVAAHRDNRVGRYPRRDGGRRQSLDKRVTRCHIVDTPWQSVEGQSHHIRVARDQILHDINEALGKSRKASHLMGYPTSCLITPAMRRRDEDNAAHERKWLEEKSTPELLSRLVPKNEIVERPSAYRIPESSPGIDGRHLGKQSALTVPDDHHLPQRCIGPIGIELFDNKA